VKNKEIDDLKGQISSLEVCKRILEQQLMDLNNKIKFLTEELDRLNALLA
jgi:predicted  nucleic acid-binding Zn-ribbon protein